MSIMKVSKFFAQWGAVTGLLLAGLVLAGCKSGGADDSRFAALPGLPATSAPATAAPSAPAQPGAAPFALGTNNLVPGTVDMLAAGDSLVVTFTDLPYIQPPLELKVREDGTITLLQNLTFTAANKKRGDLEKEIHDKYVPEYFKNMTVTINHQRESRFYSVGGDVKIPGRQIYLSRIRTLAAIQSCGDFTDFAAKRRVQLTRADGRSFTINCVKARKDPKLDLEVFPGDTIYVPRKYPWE